MRQTTVPDNRELRQQRSDVLKEARTLSAKSPRLSPADQTKFDSLMAQADELRQQYEALEARMSGAGIRGGPVVGVDAFATRTTSTENAVDREHREAFRSFLRFGRNDMPTEHRQLLEASYRAPTERRDMAINGGNSLTGVGGAYLVPISFSDAIETALKFSGNLMKYCKVMPTETGAPMPWPTADDTQQQAEIIGEGQQVTQQDVNLSNIIFGAYKFSSKMVKVSLELAQDSYWPLEDWLIEVLGVRFARALNQYFTNGLGSSQNQPMGIITAALAAGNTVAAVGSSGNDGTSASTNTIGSEDIFNLIHAVDPLYREDPSCMLMMHDQTRKKLAQLLDKYGRPLFPQSLVSGAPDMIAGYQIALNNAMDQLEINPSSPPITRNTITFGPLKKYLARRVKDMSLMVLRERFADFGQLAYIAFMRMDGNLLSGAQEAAQSPIAVLQNTY